MAYRPHQRSPRASGFRIALKHTQFAKASCATIRLKPLRIGALVRVSVHRIKLAWGSHARLAAVAR